MTVDKLIDLLMEHKQKFGSAAQIFVASDDAICRKEIYIDRDAISTILTSRGSEVEW